MSFKEPRPASIAVEAFLGSFRREVMEKSRWKAELDAATIEAAKRRAGKVFFVPISVVKSISVHVKGIYSIERLPPEILNLIFHYLIDPDDRIMLALTGKHLAAVFNHLTATDHLSSPSVLGLHTLAARVNAWVGPDKRYCRLCRRVIPANRTWWAEIAWRLDSSSLKLPSSYYHNEKLFRFRCANVLAWIDGKLDAPLGPWKPMRCVLDQVPTAERDGVMWCSVCPLHPAF